MNISNSIILGFILYTLITCTGLLAIAFFKLNKNILISLLFSPVIGISFLTIISTYLCLLGFPLKEVSLSIIVVLFFISLFIIKYYFLVINIKPVLLFLIIIFIIYIFLNIPFILGGYGYVMLRGNGWDSFNYIAIANALGNYSYNVIVHQDTVSLIELSPSMSLVKTMLTTRWSTSALLSFASFGLGTTPIEFKYVFSVVMELSILSTLLGYLYIKKSLNTFTLILIISFLLGYWGQLYLDLNSLSQLISLPILIAIIIGSQYLSSVNKEMIVNDWRIFSIIIAGIIFQYIEIFLFSALILSILYLFKLKKVSFKSVYDYAISSNIFYIILVVFIIIIPLMPVLYKFAINQVGLSVNNTDLKAWGNAYFPSLKNLPLGLWGGGSYINLPSNILNTFYRILAISSCYFLSVIYILRFFNKNFFKMPISDNDFFEKDILFIGVFISIIFYLIGNYYGAGKALVYISLFLPLSLCIFSNYLKNNNENKMYYLIIKFFIILMIIMNFLMGFARIIHSSNGTDFYKYMSHHNEYNLENNRSFDKITRNEYAKCKNTQILVTFGDPSGYSAALRTLLIEGWGYSAMLPGRTQVLQPTSDSKLEELIPKCEFYNNFRLLN